MQWNRLDRLPYTLLLRNDIHFRSDCELNLHLCTSSDTDEDEDKKREPSPTPLVSKIAEVIICF